MFYKAINFIFNAEEPICCHFGNQETGPKACGLICFYRFMLKLMVLCNQLSVLVLSTHLQGKF